MERMDLSKAADEGIAVLRASLEAQPPTGVSSEAIVSFFARYGAALSRELRGLLETALAVSEGEPPSFREALELTLVSEMVRALEKRLALTLLVRHNSKEDTFYRFNVVPIKDGVLISTEDPDGKQGQVAGQPPLLGQILAKLPQVLPAAVGGIVWNVIVKEAKLPAVEPEQRPAPVKELQASSEREQEVYDYSMAFTGIFGRNRSVKDHTVKLVKGVPRAKPKTIEELKPLMRDALEDHKVKTDASVVVKEYPVVITADGFEKHILGSARVLFRGTAGDIL